MIVNPWKIIKFLIFDPIWICSALPARRLVVKHAISLTGTTMSGNY
jgi:hypothetical protein